MAIVSASECERRERREARYKWKQTEMRAMRRMRGRLGCEVEEGEERKREGMGRDDKGAMAAERKL